VFVKVTAQRSTLVQGDNKEKKKNGNISYSVPVNLMTCQRFWRN